ncbi:hypothetical protein MNBD_NITROSPIRAE01-1924 [hydrothermal vent metagenome]|uniref:Uncharacterized protein n=1 Tax=hydrothermal vent metagenome TaxID=652676 RepID=A0A3B1CTG0_9ZZZZ
MNCLADLKIKLILPFISLLILLITVPTLAATETKDKNCQQIHEIIQSSKKKFKSIRGKLDLVSEEYFGVLTPFDLKHCFAWLNGKAYHCDSHDGMDESQVTVAYDAYITLFEDCLTNIWKKKEVNIQRANGRRIASFTSDENRLEIKIGERHKRHGWFVDFYFRR